MQQRGVVEQRLHEGAAPFELLRLPLAQQQQHSAVGYNEQTNKFQRFNSFKGWNSKGFAFPFIALKAFGTARLRLRSQHWRGSG